MSEVNIQRVAKVEDRSLPVFREMEHLFERIRSRAFDLFSGRARHGFGNAMDDWLAAERELCGVAGELVEKDGEFVLNVALAGFAPADVAVTATPRELIVRARATSELKEEPAKPDGTVHWSEFRRNDVYRSIQLPADIDVEKVKATFRNGLLSIVAAKRAMPAQVPVKVEAQPEAAAKPVPIKAASEARSAA